MKRDGDIIKALGYVTLYSAYLEESVEMVVDRLSKINGLTCVSPRSSISCKLKWCQSSIDCLGDSRLDPLKSLLFEVSGLFECRNEVIHGRIYAGNERGDQLKSGRVGIPTRIVTADELYTLAVKLLDAQNDVRYGYLLQTRAAIEKKNDN